MDTWAKPEHDAEKDDVMDRSEDGVEVVAEERHRRLEVR